MLWEANLDELIHALLGWKTVTIDIKKIKAKSLYHISKNDTLFISWPKIIFFNLNFVLFFYILGKIYVLVFLNHYQTCGTKSHALYNWFELFQPKPDEYDHGPTVSFIYCRYFTIFHFHWRFLKEINDKKVVNSLVGSCDGMFL